MRAINVGICGLGTVGSGVFNVVERNRATLAARAGREINITHIGARRDNPNCQPGETKVSRDIFAVVSDPDVDVVVELIGGLQPAKQLVLQAINNGKHVITANKALIAEHGNELFAAAREQGVQVVFEAAVAGGVPIIKVLREGLSANRIEWLAGIINGTGNFILTEMRDTGRAFADVLAEAQALGYAEADPRFDVEGIDAAHKLAILASIAFGIPLQFSKVYTEGISNISAQDVRYAQELGYRIKHLGIARRVQAGIELRVHPTLVPQERLIANVNGVMNAVLIEADAVGPTLYYGAGAGSEATASAVIADIVDVARTIDAGPEQYVPALAFQQHALSDEPVLPIDEVLTAFYLRLAVVDEPGVLSDITKMFSDAEISIEAVIQKEPKKGATTATIILLTDVVQERHFQHTLDALQGLPTITEPLVKLRVESLDG